MINTEKKAKDSNIKIGNFNIPFDNTLKVVNEPINVDIDLIKKLFSQYELYDVGVQGISLSDGIGSKRATVFDKSLAIYLNEYIIPLLNPVVLDEYSDVNWSNPKGFNYWVPSHVSPVFRYMEYNKDGQHFAHYDREYHVDETTRSLMSGVLYLTTNDVQTRFIKDGQENIKFNLRDHSDFTKQCTEKDVESGIDSIAGNVLLFPHRKCHDVSQNLKNERRIIIRFDVLYTAVTKV